MEITYIYGNAILLRFPTAVTPLHSKSTEMVGIFHKWKSFHKGKSCLIRLTLNTNLFISKKYCFSLFSRIKLLFSLLQTTKLNLAYNTTASLDKLACTDYVDFGKCQDRFERISWSKKSFDYLDVKLKVFKRDENKQVPLAQNFTMGEANFNQFIRLRNQLVVAVRDFSKEEYLPPVQVKLLAKDMEEQLKLTHKLVEVVDRPHRKICVTMLRYNVEKPETSYVQVRLFGRRKDEEKFNQVVYRIYKLDEFLYLLDVMNSVYDIVIANEPVCNVL